MRRSLFLVLVVSWPPVAAAAPPTVTYLFPAGAQRGQTVEVTAGGTFERWPVGAWADSPAITVKPGKDKGKLSVAVAADAVPGTYWIRLYDKEGASGLRPFIVGTLPEVQEQEPNDDPKKPQVVNASNVVVNGRLAQAGDVDGFVVKLAKGQTLVASLEANRTLGAPLDGVLQVVSAAGFVLEQNNDCHDLDPQLAFTAPADGIYVVRVFAFPAVPDSGIRFAGGENYVYRLTLATAGFIDFAFPLAASRSNPGSVDLVGWNIPASERQQTVRPEKGQPAYRAFHPTLAGWADVRLEPHTTVSEQRTTDTARPQVITLPVTISGRIEKPGEVDHYEFEAKKGQKMNFQVESRTLGLPLDPVVQVTDRDGKVLAQMDDAGGRNGSRDPDLAFTVPQDGTYRVEVRDLHGTGGPRHAYRLRAVLAEPDFGLSVAGDRFMVTPGKPLDIPVTIDRRNGFTDNVDMDALGLPAGVTVESLATGDGKGRTLRVTAAAGAMSGPFQIVGVAAKRPDWPQPARAPLAELNSVTSRLWLTVGGTGLQGKP